MKKYLRIKEASQYFSVSTSTIKRWIKIKKLRAYRFERIVIIKVSDIERLFSVNETIQDNTDNQLSVNDYVNDIMSEIE